MTPDEQLDFLHDQKVASCTRCPLHEHRTHAVLGEGSAEAAVFFVGEGPGAQEDQLGRPFVGRAGVYLNNILKHARLTREEVYITNLVKCHPPGNRDPEAGEIATCSSFLHAQVAVVKPDLIVALGPLAGNAMTDQSPALSEEVLQRRLWTYRNPSTGFEAPVVCIHHPAHLMRLRNDPEALRPIYRDTVASLRRAIAQTKKLDLDFDF